MTTSKWQEADSDGNAMRMHVSAPIGAGPFPGIVIMQHQGGVDEFVQQITQPLAQAGYIAAAPDLYHRDGPDCKDDIVARRSRLSDRRIINDIAATVNFLQASRFDRKRANRNHRLLHGRAFSTSRRRDESGLQSRRGILSRQYLSRLGSRPPVAVRANGRYPLSCPRLISALMIPILHRKIWPSSIAG